MYYNLQSSNKILDRIDKQITDILNQVRKTVEELKRGVPYSLKKAQSRK